MDMIWILTQLVTTLFEIAGIGILFLFFTRQFVDEEEVPEVINDVYECIFGFLKE